MSEQALSRSSQPAPPAEGREHPFGLEPRRIGPGARRVVAIVAGVLVAVGLGVLVVLTTQSHRLLDFALGELEKEVEARLPEDLAHAERERLGSAFLAAREAVRERRVGIAGLRRLQEELLGGGSETMTHDEVRVLSEALEGLGTDGEGEPPP